MIQFNLLPDVKLDYITARRTKRMVMVIAFLVTGAFLTILVLLFMVVNVFQKQHLKDVDKDIATYSKQLQGTKDLNKILTVQNQLQSLPDLYKKNPVVSRLFDDISKTTPTNVTFSKYDIDFTTNTISVDGNAASLENVNQFADTLKFTTFSTDDNTSANNKAFSSVVLASFSRNELGATYSMNFSFDPSIFDVSKNVTLTVPSTTTTRSETDKPNLNDLFKQNTTNKAQ